MARPSPPMTSSHPPPRGVLRPWRLRHDLDPDGRLLTRGDVGPSWVASPRPPPPVWFWLVGAAWISMAAPRRRLSSSPVVVLSRLGGAPHRVARLDPCRSLAASPVLWARGSGSRTCALQVPRLTTSSAGAAPALPLRRLCSSPASSVRWSSLVWLCATC
ncbi:hypothetical protein VPH35_020314 [Triticum aestivum]